MRRRLTWLLVIAGAMLAAGFATLGLAQAPKPGPVEKKIFLVPGNKPWTPTGIMLRAVDKVTLSAAGTVYFSGSAPQACPGPNGWPRSEYAGTWPDDYNFCADPIDSANHAVLLAKVGNAIFPAGASMTFTGKAGVLALGINDCTFTGSAAYLFNTGEYSVVVRVERGH